MATNTKSRLGYFYGLTESRREREAANQTGSEKFQATVGDQGAYYAVGSRIPRERKRMAGDALDLDLTSSPGTLSAPTLTGAGSAELRLPYSPS